MKRLSLYHTTCALARVFPCSWIVALAGMGCALVVSAAVAQAGAANRPNIILIVTDDQGWGDFSCHGNPVLETPHLDAMAERGVELTRFYVAPVCSPTRACLMTGRYNFRTRVIDTFRGHSMMAPEEVTVAEMLDSAGYATGIFGKWHLGDCYPMRPQDQGFDRAVVFRGGGLAQPSEPLENRQRYTDPILWRNGEQFQADGYCTDVYFDEAMHFIAEEADSARPFFAVVATNAPHGPYHDVPENLYHKYKSRDLTAVLLGDENSADTVARVFAMVENIDQNVGRLMAMLEERNLSENTLVVFMGDNGPNTRRYVGQRRGMKSEVYEGGIISPFFAQWPNRIVPGTQSDRLAAHIDVLPTLLAAAGADLPTKVEIDGRNLLPLLTNEPGDWEERNVILQSHRGSIPIAGHHLAVVGQEWKLVRPSGFGFRKLRSDVPYELYNLRDDPAEGNNLVAEKPHIAERLRHAYEAWFEDVSTTRPGNFDPPRIVVGTDHEPETVLTWQDWQADGPNWGQQGQWLISVPEPQRFQVTVVLESPAKGEGVLQFNSNSKRQRVAKPLKQVVFDDVPFPAGEYALGFSLTDGQQSVAPYQIIMSRL